MKSTGLAFLLWLLGFLGLCGLHRFYVGLIGTGLLWLFTLGLLGIGQFIDLFLLGSMVRYANLMNTARGVFTASAQATTNFSPTININVSGMEVPSATKPAIGSISSTPTNT